MLPTRDPHRTGTSLLRWAGAGAIVVVLSAGLLKVSSAARPFAASAQPAHSLPQATATVPPWSASVLTSDQLILVTLEVDPNQTGTNRFTVRLVALSTGRALTQASVSLFTTMLDMHMATTSVLMHPEGGGLFQGRGELLMGGDWEVHLLIRTAEQTRHEARIHLLTPA